MQVSNMLVLLVFSEETKQEYFEQTPPTYSRGVLDYAQARLAA
jgi:hypothetical protein